MLRWMKDAGTTSIDEGMTMNLEMVKWQGFSPIHKRKIRENFLSTIQTKPSQRLPDLKTTEIETLGQQNSLDKPSEIFRNHATCNGKTNTQK